ncbi:MAG: hypothetical protein GX213_10330 [Clostridiaceae bacterium]|nr:hypothetical protein [Clostridiaceae bacterium]
MKKRKSTLVPKTLLHIFIYVALTTLVMVVSLIKMDMVRKGYLDKAFLEVGEKALNAVLGKIDNNGILHGVSYGTPVFRTAEEYKNVPVCPMPYGQSMALMLLAEALNCKKYE